MQKTYSYFVLALYLLYSNFLWQKLIKENHRAIKISTQQKENRIYQNRTVCSNLTISNTSVTPKNLKNQDDLSNLYINLLQKESGQKRLKNENYFRERKVSMDNMFYVVFTKPLDENTSKKSKKKDEKTQILALCLAKGVKLQRLVGGNPTNKFYFLLFASCS